MNNIYLMSKIGLSDDQLYIFDLTVEMARLKGAIFDNELQCYILDFKTMQDVDLGILSERESKAMSMLDIMAHRFMSSGITSIYFKVS